MIIHFFIYMFISSLSGEDGRIKPGILEYLMDGIIPLLHAYYSSFFNPFDTPIESQKINEFDVSAQILNSLLVQFILHNTKVCCLLTCVNINF